MSNARTFLGGAITLAGENWVNGQPFEVIEIAGSEGDGAFISVAQGRDGPVQARFGFHRYADVSYGMNLRQAQAVAARLNDLEGFYF